MKAFLLFFDFWAIVLLFFFLFIFALTFHKCQIGKKAFFYFYFALFLRKRFFYFIFALFFKKKESVSFIFALF